LIQRRKYAQNIENNRTRIEQNESIYKKRQAIVEHPYGTIKRQWGFSYITTKKYIKRASSDVGLMFVAYNIRRIINILGKNELKKYLERVVFSFLHQLCEIRHKYLRSNASKLCGIKIWLVFEYPLKSFKFDQLLMKSMSF